MRDPTASYDSQKQAPWRRQRAKPPFFEVARTTVVAEAPGRRRSPRGGGRRGGQLGLHADADLGAVLAAVVGARRQFLSLR